MWYLCLYLPALFSIQNLTFANVRCMLRCRIKMFLNTRLQPGKVITTWQDWALLTDELCPTIAQQRVNVLKQTLASTSHVYQTVWPKARRHIVEHGVRRRWGVRIEVGSLQNRAELCAIFFSSLCSVTSSSVFELPSNSPTALCIFLHRSLTVLRRWMISVLIFRFSVLDKYLCKMDRVHWIVLPQSC